MVSARAARMMPAFCIVALGLILSPHSFAQQKDKEEEHAPGIYLADPADGATPHLVRLVGSKPQEVKTKGLGKAMLTQGLLKPSTVWELGGPASDFRITQTTPTFYFYFQGKSPDTSDPMAMFSQMMDADTMPAAARTPGDFALVALTVTGDTRQSNMGKMGTGSRPKNTVDCTQNRLAQGAYTLSPKNPLKPGEYAFFFLSGAGPSMGGFAAWDFGVDAPK